MNDVTATHPQHTDVLWKKISSTLNAVQKFTEEKTLATTKELLANIPLDALSTNEVGSGIAIVYRPYNRSELELVAQREEGQNKETNSPTDYTLLAEVVDNSNNEPILLPNENLSLAGVGFSEYKSVLIIPIHLHYKMGINVGAVILHHKIQENAYSDTEVLTVWKTFVKRLAFSIQHHHQARRDQLSSKARIDLLQKLTADQFTEEHEIIREIVQQIRQWYKEDRLFIIMKHLLDVDNYVFAYNGENDAEKALVENFRLQRSIAPEKLTPIIGSQEIINKLREEHGIHADGIILSQEEIRAEGIDINCKSWLGITFYHPLGFALGHIILHNPTSHAYTEVESRFFSNFADLLGIVLANFRNKQKEKVINKIKDEIIEQNADEKNEDYYSRCEINLCNTIATFLERIYGVHSLLIAKIDRRTQQFIDILNQENITFDQAFQSIVRTHIDKLRLPPNDVKQNLRNHAIELTVEYPGNSDNKYLIAPMLVQHTSSANDWQIIGCFITKAKRAGGLTAKAIDEISNALAERLIQFDRLRRYDVLNQLSKDVAELKSNNLTKQGILEVAHKHIKEIMFGDNLYISLYDKNKKEISFPLMYVNGKLREQPSRIIDPNALGRTEEIILTEKPLRHRTKEESKAWYKTPGHGEFMGNRLASWVGVPIFSPNGVNGVIAAYHPDLDSIYSKLDVFFLTNIASQVSGLFRALEQSQVNQKLEELSKKVVQLELERANSAMASDLTHRIKNSSGSMKNYLDSIRRKVVEAIKSKNTDSLDGIVNTIGSINRSIDYLITSINNITKNKNKYEEVNVKNALDVVARDSSERIDSEIGFEFSNEINPATTLFTKESELYDCLNNIFNNAVDAIRMDAQFNTKKKYIITCTAKMVGENIVIEITDNGTPIPEESKKHIFEYGYTTKTDGTGYGLWRSRVYFETMKGKIELGEYEYSDEIKVFKITIPSSSNNKTNGNDKKIAFLLEDEEDWRIQLKEFLENMNLDVHVATNREDMNQLLAKRISPDIVILDKNLQPEKTTDAGGIIYAKKIKECYPNTKIIMISGYLEYSDRQQQYIDSFIDKIDENMKQLDEDKLKIEIQKLISLGE